MTTHTFMKAATAAKTSDPNSTDSRPGDCTYQASILGTAGAQTATVIIEGSNEEQPGGNFLAIGTITLSGTSSDSQGFVSQAKWGFVRARLTAITGTGAAVTVTMGY